MIQWDLLIWSWNCRQATKNHTSSTAMTSAGRNGKDYTVYMEITRIWLDS